MMQTVQQIGVVMLGGAMGAACRYAVALSLRPLAGVYPVATVVVNLLGCLLIGLAMGWSEKYGLSESLKLFVVVGVLGAFTTFSTFGLDLFQLVQTYRFGWQPLSYLLISILLGYGMVVLGLKLTA